MTIGWGTHFLASSTIALWDSTSASNRTVAFCSIASLDSSEATLEVYNATKLER